VQGRIEACGSRGKVEGLSGPSTTGFSVRRCATPHHAAASPLDRLAGPVIEALAPNWGRMEAVELLDVRAAHADR